MKKTFTFFVSVILVLFISFSLLIGMLLLSEYQNSWNVRNIVRPFNIMNAHLKDICTERAIKDECPRDESQVRSYNPTLYAQIEESTDMYYHFNEFTQQHTFAVRVHDVAYVSHDDFYPHYGYLTLEEAAEQYGIQFNE